MKTKLGPLIIAGSILLVDATAKAVPVPLGRLRRNLRALSCLLLGGLALPGCKQTHFGLGVALLTLSRIILRGKRRRRPPSVDTLGIVGRSRTVRVTTHESAFPGKPVVHEFGEAAWWRLVYAGRKHSTQAEQEAQRAATHGRGLGRTGS